MVNKTLRKPLRETEMLIIPNGGYQPGKNGYYDACYSIGYSFAWLCDYIGRHSGSYGIAFK